MTDRILRTARLSNFQSMLPAWYRFHNKAASTGAARVDIYDEIGFMSVGASAFVGDLANVDGDLELHINSPGGDIFEAITIWNALQQHPGSVAVIVDGMAYSAASYIAQAASPGMLAMAPHSEMMLHDGLGMAIGHADDMVNIAARLNRASDNIAGIYADRAGQDKDYWRAQMKATTFYSDQEAVDAGLADMILGRGQPVQNKWDLSVFENAAAPGWDGPAAMSRASHASDPASAFRDICAGEKTVGDPDTQAHWALPHHDSAGMGPNAKGVSSALGYLPRTDDLKDPAAARAHLEAHQRELDGGAHNHAGWDQQAYLTAYGRP